MNPTIKKSVFLLMLSSMLPIMLAVPVVGGITSLLNTATTWSLLNTIVFSIIIMILILTWFAGVYISIKSIYVGVKKITEEVLNEEIENLLNKLRGADNGNKD